MDVRDGAGRWVGIGSRDAGTREEAMEIIRQDVMSRAEGIGPIRETMGQFPGGVDLNDTLARLLMLSKRCPFQDVREKCLQVLQGVQEIGVRIPRPLGQGPSRFIPETKILQAAARHQCSYLVNLHVDDFLQVGGNPKWLNGLEGAPQKLQSLGELNKILAHRPWLITKEHIEQLLKAEDHSWSLAELIHAVVLLTHYHSLASFTFGCGINPEIHCEGGHTFRPPSVSNYCVCDLANGNSSLDEMQINQLVTDASCEVEALMEKMKQLQECRDEEEASQEEMTTRFEREKTESMLVASTEEEESAPTRDVSRHFEDPSYGYKDFSRRGEHVPTFRAQDYTWEDHGYSLVNRLYPDFGQLLDEKFQIAYNLTYNTMAMHRDVDTSMLRRAIWNYIHCMFGIRYDDYDYGEINQLLDRSFKVYIKTMVCSPEKTTKRMYDSFWRQFEHSEKVHVNLLLMEARMQAELLYALRAITRYMT
ncbi:sestrin-1 isoform X3 [Polypterus senegalus]|uniref:sestrin-1 isoform X3 n=1 Tax=Polypterus senegalus TaxID=55291 RepID=UPI001963486F|nr:sestrin-1 isoform X3 [Polypterus senegalus]